MNAQEIQRVKDALEIGYDAACEVAQRFHEEMRGYREGEHKQVDADAAEVQACIILVGMWLAERAVSPAESMQSVDLSKYHETISLYAQLNGEKMLWDRAKGCEQPPSYYIRNGICYALQALLSSTAQPLLDEAKPNCRMQGGICACRSGGSYGGCAIECQAAGKPLFANDAQPLQQPLNKIIQGDEGPIAIIGTNDDLQPLQQEGGKEVRHTMTEMQFDDGHIGWYYDAGGVYIDVEKDAEGNLSVFVRDRNTEKTGWLDQADNLRQASTDKLQSYLDASQKLDAATDNFYGQASTAQADPAKPNADCSGEPANCPDNEGYGCACDPMNNAIREQSGFVNVTPEHEAELLVDIQKNRVGNYVAPITYVSKTPETYFHDFYVANAEAFSVLVDIFENGLAYEKVKINVNSDKNVTIYYRNMDEEWCKELHAALESGSQG